MKRPSPTKYLYALKKSSEKNSELLQIDSTSDILTKQEFITMMELNR